MADVSKETQPISIDPSEGDASNEAVHGGEEDPLGGGVAELEDDERVTEGVPKQEN